jgi:hypothetical protein
MLCQKCNVKLALVHLTTAPRRDVQHLCQECLVEYFHSPEFSKSSDESSAAALRWEYCGEVTAGFAHVRCRVQGLAGDSLTVHVIRSSIFPPGADVTLHRHLIGESEWRVGEEFSFTCKESDVAKLVK